MDKKELGSFLSALNTRLGPATFTRSIDFGAGVGVKKFTFRRLSFLESQRMREQIKVLNESPEEMAKFKDNLLLSPCMQLAAMLIDDKGEPLATFDEVRQWPGFVIDKLFVEAMQVNVETVASKEAIAKKSRKIRAGGR